MKSPNIIYASTFYVWYNFQTILTLFELTSFSTSIKNKEKSHAVYSNEIF